MEKLKRGQLVTDASGQAWKYRGKFKAELGSITKDGKLASLVINGEEKPVTGIHPETIPGAEAGDYFEMSLCSEPQSLGAAAPATCNYVMCSTHEDCGIPRDLTCIRMTCMGED